MDGQGEHGSIGFDEAIADNMDWFAGASLLLNNNNTWMGEERPCLTYGLRGCIEVDITVRCKRPGCRIDYPRFATTDR